RACAINVGNTWFPGLTWCGSRPSVVRDNSDRIAELQGLIENLEGQVVPTRACPAPPIIRTEAPSPNDVTAKEIEKRLEEVNAPSGELDISLGWNGPADLDLHVVCPSGESIFFHNKAACGGEHKVDWNAPPNHSNEPVEHIIFPSMGAIPAGVLKVGVVWF